MGTSAGSIGRIQSRFEEHRLFLRKRILQPFSIELSPGKKAWLYDLSEGGLRVYGGSGLDLGTSAYVRFQFPEANTVIDAFGVVAWNDPSGGAGVRFTHMQPESTAGLRRWLESESTTADSVATASKDDSVLASRISSLAQVSELQAEISSRQLAREAVLDLIVCRMMEVTRASGAAIALREADHVVCRASVGNAPDVGVKLSSSSLSGECFRTGTVVLLSDSEADSRVDPEVCRQLNFRSLLVLPITAGEESIGIAEVLSPNPRNFEGGDILVVSFLAEMIVSCVEPPKQIAQSELLDVVSLLSAEPMAAPEAAIAESMIGSPATAEPTGNGFEVASGPFLAPILAPEEPVSVPIPETPVPLVAAPLDVIADPLPDAVAEQPTLLGPIQAAVTAPADAPLEGALAKAVGEGSPVVPPIAKPLVRPVLIPEGAVPSPAAKLTPATPVSIAEPKPQLFSLAEPPKPSWTLALATAIVGLLVSAGLLFSYHRHNGTASPAQTATAPAAKPVVNSEAPPPSPVIAPTPTPASALIASKPTSPPTMRLPTVAEKRRLNESELNEPLVIHSAASSRPLPADSPAPEAPTIALASSGLGTLPEGVTAAAPKPKLQVSQPQSVIQDVIPGRLLKKVAPQYPDLALRAGVSGNVVLLAVIGTDGRLRHIHAISGSPVLREEAVAAAKQWRYAPATLSGKPVESDTRIIVNFTINSRQSK